MRKALLAGVAIAGALSASLAQTPPVLPYGPTQGQSVSQATGKSVATANDNNNSQAPALPGPLANPTPGTVVVHIDGRVNTGFASFWSNLDKRSFTTAPAIGTAKLQPDTLYYYARLYFGADAMASNGLRYGAAIEIRQNYPAFQASTSSDGASGYTSLETLFVRRAFTYVAGEHWGILRTGQADGIVSLFDNGATTLQYLPTGNLQNGSDLASLAPGNNAVPFFFLSGDGNEYGYGKAVYLSPQVSGFDFGVQYSPTIANGFATCNTATVAGASGCPTLSSGPGSTDGARVLNHTAIGVRYQGVLSGVGLLAYAAYGFSGHSNYTGPTTAAALGNTVAGSQYTGKFDGLNYGNGGLALTYGGFTIGGNIIGGRINGVLGLMPQNGTSEIAYLIGAKYVAGPFTIGISAERGTFQGNANLTGISQRRGQALDVGASYAVAPGFTVYAEYQYQNLRQSDFNFVTSSIGSSANNSADSQGFVIGNVVNF
jgi:predicted porin